VSVVWSSVRECHPSRRVPPRRARADKGYISKPARYITAAIAVATLGLEVWAYLAYRDTVDGQAVLVNFAILVYAFIAAGVVFGIDEVVRHLSHRRRGV
jgi:hypothetical protein